MDDRSDAAATGSLAMMIARSFAVLAAIALVLAFTLATLLPPFESFAELMANLDHPALVWLTRVGGQDLPGWLWGGMIVPILLRPAWLVPVAVGLVCVGCAITLASRKGVTRSHRRRS